MKSSKAPLSAKLALYAAAAAVVCTGEATTASAAIIYNDPADITVPNNIDGVYLNLTTGASSTSAIAGYDLNPFGLTDGLSFLTPMDGGGALATSASGPIAALSAGALIGPNSSYRVGAVIAPNFRVTDTKFLGLRFINDVTGAINYGWVEFTTTASTGFPATINRFAYENTGVSLLAGQTGVVPEPGTVAVLGVFGLGAAGVRAWRRRKVA